MVCNFHCQFNHQLGWINNNMNSKSRMKPRNLKKLDVKIELGKIYFVCWKTVWFYDWQFNVLLRSYLSTDLYLAFQNNDDPVILYQPQSFLPEEDCKWKHLRLVLDLAISNKEVLHDPQTICRCRYRVQPRIVD